MVKAVNWLQKELGELSAVCCIYATAPFLQKDDLINAFEIFNINRWNFVFSSTKYPFPIQRAFTKIETGGIKMLNPESFETRSQDFDQSYHDAGQFYWGKPSAWLNKKKIFDIKSTIYELPAWRVQDIDTAEDWNRAEIINKLQNTIKKKNMSEKDKIDHYLHIIDEIEKIRTKNNVNWMDVLRLAFKNAPEEAKKLMKRINAEDNRISELFKKLSE